ncbi:MAG: hypothetical protein ACOCRL_00685 [Bacillota bacterium]
MISKINYYNWKDWNLDNIKIDFEKITVKLSDDNDINIQLDVYHYIGLSYLGHWDETVIDDIKVSKTGELIKKSIDEVTKNYGKNPIKGGGIKNINDDWLQINIKLIDGVVIKFVCREIGLIKIP